MKHASVLPCFICSSIDFCQPGAQGICVGGFICRCPQRRCMYGINISGARGIVACTGTLIFSAPAVQLHVWGFRFWEPAATLQRRRRLRQKGGACGEGGVRRCLQRSTGCHLPRRHKRFAIGLDGFDGLMGLMGLSDSCAD